MGESDIFIGKYGEIFESRDTSVIERFGSFVIAKLTPDGRWGQISGTQDTRFIDIHSSTFYNNHLFALLSVWKPDDDFVYVSPNGKKDTIFQHAPAYFIVKFDTNLNFVEAYISSSLTTDPINGFRPGFIQLISIDTATITVAKIMKGPNLDDFLSPPADHNYFEFGYGHSIYEKTFGYRYGFGSILKFHKYNSLRLDSNESCKTKRLVQNANVRSCGSYRSLKGNTYVKSGNYSEFSTSFQGCDTIITKTNLNVKIESPFTLDTTVEACRIFISPKGEIHKHSIIITELLEEEKGCDSIVQIDLRIHHNKDTSYSISTCSDYALPSGNLVANSGTYIDSIKTVRGCDSVMTINVSITQLDTTVVVTDSSLISMDSLSQHQWYNCKTNLIVDGANDRIFSPTTTGNYSVILNQNLCTDTSDCNLIEVLSVRSTNQNSLLKVYPNPTTGLLNLHFSKFEKQVFVEVFDATGSLVQNRTYYNSQHIQLNLHAKPGMYTVKLSTTETTHLIKIIKR
jgi:hypothetical protein